MTITSKIDNASLEIEASPLGDTLTLLRGKLVAHIKNVDLLGPNRPEIKRLFVCCKNHEFHKLGTGNGWVIYGQLVRTSVLVECAFIQQLERALLARQFFTLRGEPCGRTKFVCGGLRLRGLGQGRSGEEYAQEKHRQTNNFPLQLPAAKPQSDLAKTKHRRKILAQFTTRDFVLR